MQLNAMPGRTKRQTTPPPFKNRRGVHVLQVQTPITEHRQNNKLTVYLEDVASADHGDKALRPGPKPNLERMPNRISRESFPDVSLHGSGLEFAGKTAQSREGDRKVVGDKRKGGCACPVSRVRKW
jgi:hypothetical protein